MQTGFEVRAVGFLFLLIILVFKFVFSPLAGWAGMDSQAAWLRLGILGWCLTPILLSLVPFKPPIGKVLVLVPWAGLGLAGWWFAGNPAADVQSLEPLYLYLALASAWVWIALAIPALVKRDTLLLAFACLLGAPSLYFWTSVRTLNRGSGSPIEFHDMGRRLEEYRDTHADAYPVHLNELPPSRMAQGSLALTYILENVTPPVSTPLRDDVILVYETQPHAAYKYYSESLESSGWKQVPAGRWIMYAGGRPFFMSEPDFAAALAAQQAAVQQAAQNPGPTSNPNSISNSIQNSIPNSVANPNVGKNPNLALTYAAPITISEPSLVTALAQTKAGAWSAAGATLGDFSRNPAVFAATISTTIQPTPELLQKLTQAGIPATQLQGLTFAVPEGEYAGANMALLVNNNPNTVLVLTKRFYSHASVCSVGPVILVDWRIHALACDNWVYVVGSGTQSVERLGAMAAYVQQSAWAGLHQFSSKFSGQAIFRPDPPAQPTAIRSAEYDPLTTPEQREWSEWVLRSTTGQDLLSILPGWTINSAQGYQPGPQDEFFNAFSNDGEHFTLTAPDGRSVKFYHFPTRPYDFGLSKQPAGKVQLCSPTGFVWFADAKLTPAEVQGLAALPK